MNKYLSILQPIAEVIIAKQRQGATGTVELAWIKECTKFASLEKEEAS